MTLTVRGNPVTTTATEFRLLDYFARHIGPRIYPRSVARFGLARHRLRHPAFGGCLRAPHSRKNRARSGKSALPQDGPRRRLPLRGPEVRNRIFFKLLGAFVLVIGGGHGDLAISRFAEAWEQSLREQIERNLRQKTLMFAIQ